MRGAEICFVQSVGHRSRGGAFCPNCGNKMVYGSSAAQPAAGPKAKAASGMPKKKKGAGKLIGAILAVVILLAAAAAAVFFLVLNRKITIDLNEYTTAKFSGYDSVGRAEVSIDWKSIEQKYGDRIRLKTGQKLQRSDRQDIISEFDDAVLGKEWADVLINDELKEDGIDILQDTVYTVLSREDHLSNGEQIELTWEMDEEALDLLDEYTNLTLTFSDMTFTAEGLEAVAKFDPFAVVSLKCSGMDGEGDAELIVEKDDNRGEQYGYLTFSMQYEDGTLKNGDEITVTAELNCDEEDFADRFGEVPDPMEKTFTVEGLAFYPDSAEDISEDMLADLKDYTAQKLVKNNTGYFDGVRGSSYNTKFEEFSYLGYYWFTPGQESSEHNKILLIYKDADKVSWFKDDDYSVDYMQDTEPVEMYRCVEYTDLLLNTCEVPELSVNLDTFREADVNYSVEFPGKDFPAWGLGYTSTWDFSGAFASLQDLNLYVTETYNGYKKEECLLDKEEKIDLEQAEEAENSSEEPESTEETMKSSAFVSAFVGSELVSTLYKDSTLGFGLAVEPAFLLSGSRPTYIYDPYEETGTRYQYNPGDKIISKELVGYSDNPSPYQYEYDEQDNIVSCKKVDGPEDETDSSYTVQNQYDSDDNLTESRLIYDFKQSGDKTGENYIYEYDNQNRIISARREIIYENGKTEENVSIKLYYDSEGFLNKADIVKTSDSDSYEYTLNFTYSDGRMITVALNSDFSKLTYNFTYQTQDGTDQLMKCECMNDENGEKDSYWEFIYNNEGYVSDSTYHDFSSDSTEYTSYQYE